MPQFSMIPSRERILARIPDYAVELEPAGSTVTVSIDGTRVARSTRALLVKETKHADVYYLPREDVNLDAFEPTEHSTYCPFKGHANYFSFGGHDNVVWSYEDPYPEVAGLQDYLSFYPDRADISAD